MSPLPPHPSSPPAHAAPLRGGGGQPSPGGFPNSSLHGSRANSPAAAQRLAKLSGEEFDRHPEEEHRCVNLSELLILSGDEEVP